LRPGDHRPNRANPVKNENAEIVHLGGLFISGFVLKNYTAESATQRMISSIIPDCLAL